jgi:DNA-binding transcriptional LysR family regulator
MMQTSESGQMPALIDVDQLRTFIAIAETGSFTRAAEIVHKTQSAVSMQMKRLEERLNRPIFARDGRASKLTDDGQRLLDYARRIVRLNVEALAAFSEADLAGHVRLGVPDDYADRYLPEIMARFSRVYPAVELSVICEPTVDLLKRIDANEVDLAIVTNCDRMRPSEVFRRERLLWVTSNRHAIHQEDPLPLALGRPTCAWRRTAIEGLESAGRSYRVLYSSSNVGAVAAAVLAGLAISVLPESSLRPGMRVLTAADGFGDLPSCRIGLVRSPHETSALTDALAEHIISSLDNLSETSQAAE